jgi:hypothetical protein
VQHAAAARTFDILTDWLRAHPRCSYFTRANSIGRFRLTVWRGPEEMIASFEGGSIQDAYAQAAQVLALDGDFNGEGP